MTDMYDELFPEHSRWDAERTDDFDSPDEDEDYDPLDFEDYDDESA